MTGGQSSRKSRIARVGKAVPFRWDWADKDCDQPIECVGVTAVYFENAVATIKESSCVMKLLSTQVIHYVRHSREGGNPANQAAREADKTLKLTRYARIFSSTGFPPSRE
jgi:hypothetical protein